MGIINIQALEDFVEEASTVGIPPLDLVAKLEGVYYHDEAAFCTKEIFGKPIIYCVDPDEYESQDVSKSNKAIRVEGGLLYADEFGEYYLSGVNFLQLLVNPYLLNNRTPT